MIEKRQSRREAVSGHKRELILAAAKQVFADEGLEGASLRAIAVRAGYTPAALYFHFESKEAIYAEVLKASLTSLGAAVDRAVAQTRTSAQKLKAAAMSFFRFYAENPQDLDLGFYLFRGGMIWIKGTARVAIQSDGTPVFGNRPPEIAQSSYDRNLRPSRS